MIELVKNQCSSSIKTFEEKACKGQVPWLNKGILMSEGFAVCAIADLYNIDVLVESGIYDGKSTTIWASYLSDRRIISMDKKLRKGAFNRLKKYKNLRVINADSTKALIRTVRKRLDKSVGVFIDGPKGMVGCNLAAECFKLNNVSFVAIHDVNKANNRDKVEKVMDGVGAFKFFTDEKWFVDEYGYLDKNESQKHNTGDVWKPYKRIRGNRVADFGGSYGWTVGFFLKEGIV